MSMTFLHRVLLRIHRHLAVKLLQDSSQMNERKSYYVAIVPLFYS